jgi:pimeloyl-ACP methyl ester carboxylesterase
MRSLFLLLLVMISMQVNAKQLVLIQGYLADSNSWREAGISAILSKHGWSYAGEYHYNSHGVRLFQPVRSSPDKRVVTNSFYQVSLPTEASIQNQAYYLTSYLHKIRSQYPDQKIILLGHSAGGVVARYVMVRNPELNISQLITIASPHLGTDTAEFGKLMGESPLSMIAPMIGAGTLNRSQALYTDLLPELPYRFLYWLNRQPHPDAEYISIVRNQMSPSGGDLIVPQGSQYLEKVYDLKDRSRSYIVQGSHALNSNDGWLILDLINERVMQKI